MQIRVHTLTQQNGQTRRQSRTINAELLRIGRGGNNELHLPDARVSLQHATAYFVDETFFLDSPVGKVQVAGRLESSLTPTSGQVIEIGPYNLIFEQIDVEKSAIELSVELVRPLPLQHEALLKDSRVNLWQGGLSKRWLAWLGAVGVLSFFLVLPVIHALSPAVRAVTTKWGAPPDLAWNVGALYAGHQPFYKDCAKCHQVPFEHVQNKVCSDCHKAAGNHVDQRSPAISHFESARCTECHRDHKGAAGLARLDEGFCVSCHGNLAKFGGVPTAQKVTNFTKEHPEFRLSIFQRGNVVRVAQSNKGALTEQSGLKFPHMPHLQPKGVRSPEGRVIMDCKNCHTLDAGGKRFKPINMKEHCQSCHELNFEPLVTSRQVPHGDMADVITTLREFYASLALGTTPPDVKSLPTDMKIIRMPGIALGPAERAIAVSAARSKVDRIATELVEVRVCTTCHTIDRVDKENERSWKIGAVNIQTHWFSKARFAHNKHRATECGECHDVKISKQSADIAIPDIKNCRGCHEGSDAAAGKVPSTCVTCHGFHNDAERPLGAPLKTPPLKKATGKYHAETHS